MIWESVGGQGTEFLVEFPCFFSALSPGNSIGHNFPWAPIHLPEKSLRGSAPWSIGATVLHELAHKTLMGHAEGSFTDSMNENGVERLFVTWNFQAEY